MKRKKGRPRKFRKLVSGQDSEEEDDILDLEEESVDKKSKSWKRIRSAQFLEIFQDMYGDVTEEHPDRERFNPKTVRLSGSTVGYVESLRRMQKMGMFADIPADVVLQMESEVKGMYIFNHKDADMLNYPLMVHVAVRFLYWYLLGANKATAATLKYMTKMNSERFKLKTQRLKVDQGYVLEQEALLHHGLVEEVESTEEIEEVDTSKDAFDFDGLDDLF
ncbi:MAG: hypothetical protein CMB45_06285 [Euryarchaeota archaeon]|nr:hypothetical protein [Euryarchaeota archaeon]